VKLHPYISYDTEATLQTKIVIPKMKAQDFITSLPDGLFTHFQGCKPGTFDYKLDFKFNKTNRPTRFFDNLKGKFKITKYGEGI
jgi:hypothetical protein